MANDVMSYDTNIYTLKKKQHCTVFLTQIPISHFVTTENLLESLRLLLIGCESPLFQRRHPTKQSPAPHDAARAIGDSSDDDVVVDIVALPGLRVSGLDSASLRAFLDPFLNHFRYVKNLLELSDWTPNETSLKAKGLVYQVC